MSLPTVQNTTLEYFDGFDDYSTVQATRYWLGECTASGNPGVMGTAGALSVFSISSGNGRNGTASMRMSGNQGNSLIITLTPQPTRTVGIALKMTNFSINNNFLSIFNFCDTTNIQLALRLNGDGTLSVVRGAGTNNGGTYLATSIQSLSSNVYYYIEFSATIHPTAGAYTVKVNGVTWLTATNVNTRQTGNSSSNQVALGGVSSPSAGGITWDFDDFYSRTDNVFMGDIRVESHLPSSNGATNNFIRGGTDSGANWSQVNDNPANDDTSYVQSANAGDVDLYNYTPLVLTTGTVYGVMVCPMQKVDTAGTVTSCSVYRSPGGTVYQSGTQSIGVTTYSGYPDIQGKDPSTSANWTIAGVNGFQYGLQRLT
jgi:hypothetical protein